MGEETILKLTRDQRVEKLKEIGQHSSGTLGEMKMRLKKFNMYPKLYQRLKLRARREFSHPVSTNILGIFFSK